jgi:hypothetical protein
MATSSKQTQLFGVNDWKAIYQTFRQADFRSYDYETLRKSFIDYLRTYYPETFNDYVESSEFIALLDVMAFMGQGLAFRNDLNTRENFIDTAERRDSVIKLANLVGYTPKRNIAAEGYVKVTSISTTQNLVDLNGQNLSNIPILWNDPANPNWLEQFNTIINAALIDSQKLGRPGNVSDILGVTTSEYSIAIPQGSLPIAPFSTTVDNIKMNFELVSVTSVDQPYVYEIPPSPNGRFNMLYRNDKLGFGSPNTGFFFYFKQGTLQNFDFTLQEQIANQNVDIGSIEGINNTDTWLYQLNDNNGGRTEWKKVESVYADAYLQTESSQRTIFSVASRFNDQVTYVFGDGVFSKIPVGTFRAYVRSGNALTYTIDPSEMLGLTVAIGYVSRQGRQETLTVGLTLTEPVSNAQERESLIAIKQRAPTRYYSQNRMVNGEDYNNFPYTLYSSIIKSKAVNRSSIGVSKNLDLLDPTGKYSSILSLGNDGALWRDKEDNAISFSFDSTSDIMFFLTQTLTNTLGKIEAYQYYTTYYPRYTAKNASTDLNIYWKIAVVDGNSMNGYLTNYPALDKNALSVGIFTTNNIKYFTQGALVKITAPSGKYFDSNFRLVNGLPGPSDFTFYWTTVLQVVGDGANAGEGLFPNGTGPITLNGYVPTGSIISEIIPAFSSDLPANIILEAKQRLELNESFSLVFNNKLKIDEDRWTIRPIDAENSFVKFTSQNLPNTYLVTTKQLKYYFGSVDDVRFSFPQNELVYDPFTGTVLRDDINVLGINTVVGTSTPLSKDYRMNITGQTIESDGYINDYEVIVSTTTLNNNTLVTNPDFFSDITGFEYVTDANGYKSDAANRNRYVFFETIQDAVNLTRQQILPSSDVIYAYATKDEIEIVKYEYPVNTLFYAYGTNQFYRTFQDTNVSTQSYTLNEVYGYSIMYGRQGLTYKYTHNSNNTVRIDPATTNIIDLYLVTQSYYTAYQNYIQDTTGTVPKPPMPTMTELNAEYEQIQNYKMLSDSVILNSVVFKPLFGPKAAQALQGTIKIIKNSTTTASDSEIRSAVLTAMNAYFDIQNWNFGDTFYFSELSAYLHSEIGDFVSSAVLVPNDPNETFGDLYEIKCQPYEIFVNAATANDVVIIAALTPDELKAV